MRILHEANGIKLVQVTGNNQHTWIVLQPDTVLGERFMSYNDAIDRFDTLIHGK